MLSLLAAAALAVSPYSALQHAYRKVGGIDADRLSTATLVPPRLIQQRGRAVYEMYVPSLRPYDRWYVQVDAETGRIVKKVNRTRAIASELRVYAPQPSLGFLQLDVETFTADKLENDRFSTSGCAASNADQMEFYVAPLGDSDELGSLKDYVKRTMNLDLTWFVMPLCKMAPTATTLEMAQPLGENAALAMRDPFAEQNFFAHAERISLWYANAYGYDGRNGDPMATVVNFVEPSIESLLCTSVAYTKNPDGGALAAFNERREQPVPTTTGFRGCQVLPASGTIDGDDFAVFDNAFFMPKVPASELGLGDGWLARFGSKDLMLFGQGSAADFAYDPSVIYHEYTHGVVSSLNVLGDYLRADEFGLDSAPGALNEALADYFALALVNGNGCIGPIAGALVDRECLRDLDEQTRCPDVLAGEEHIDSTPMSTGLWAARKAYPEASRPTFDRAVFEALAAMPADPSFALLSAKVLENTTMLGLDAAPARAALDESNVVECERVKTIALGRESAAQAVYGTGDLGDYEIVPGFVQYQTKINASKQLLRVTVRDATKERGVDQPKPLARGDADVRVIVSFDGPPQFDPNSLQPTGPGEELELTDRNYAELAVADGPHDVNVALVNRGLGSRYLTLEIELKAAPQVVPQAPVEEPKKEGCSAAGEGSLLAFTWLAARNISNTRSRSRRRDLGDPATRPAARG